MIVKPADASIDYPITWELADSETIVSATHSVNPIEVGGVAMKSGSDEISGDSTSCLFEGGIWGNLYEVSTSIITSLGRRDSRALTLRIGTVEAVQ